MTAETKNAFRLFALIFINYGLNAISFRMLAKVNYLGVAGADAMLAWWGFTMVQRIGVAETRREQVFYTLGGICGSMFGLWLTTLMEKL
jgi:hypothetical protein